MDLSRPGLVRPHFQPIVDLARGRVCGYEALSRFSGPPDLPPDRWFAAAAQAGVGAELEALALDAALRGRAALPGDCFLAVNLGPDALLSAPVHEVLARAGDLRGVVVELTEQAPVEDYDRLRASIAPLRERGAQLAIDDAGAGFASLHHVMALRPDLVKVDRSLVAGIDTDETKAAVVATLGFFANRLDAWLLAEGVETLFELDRLLELGVPLGQGWVFARAAPAMTDIDADATALCRRRAASNAPSALHALTRPVPWVFVDAADATITTALQTDPATPWIAVVDEFERPIELLAGATPGARATPLVAQSSDVIADVVRRALTRSAPERLLPIAVVDERGRLVGVVAMERLITHLAELAGGTLAQPAKAAADPRSPDPGLPA